MATYNCVNGIACRGGSRISEKGVNLFKGGGFALLILSNFSKISHENENNLVSLRPNYFIFIGYLKPGGGGGGGGGGVRANPLWIRHWL